MQAGGPEIAASETPIATSRSRAACGRSTCGRVPRPGWWVAGSKCASDFGADLEAAGTDPGADRHLEPFRPGARGARRLDAGLEHAAGNPAPAGMQRPDDPALGLEEEDRETVGDRDQEREPRTRRDETIGFPREPGARRGHHPPPMDLVHAGDRLRLEPARRIEAAPVLGHRLRMIVGPAAQIQRRKGPLADAAEA